ncbi:MULTISPECIES: hypothetical protein [unclassified Streptomyces]|uniref:hypothetical protein n=1 Tax=unclassified Streptomyces TaxID=2593676 RepID=UPI003316B63E
MATLNPGAGTAEIRHTPSFPYRTVALPPVDGMVCGPDPPRSQLWAGVRGVPLWVEEALARLLGADGRGVFAAEGDGEEACGPGAEGEVEALAETDAEAEAVTDAGGLDEGNTVGADRATGGFGRVEPVTKSTVAMTAVTLAAVQDTHMSR